MDRRFVSPSKCKSLLQLRRSTVSDTNGAKVVTIIQDGKTQSDQNLLRTLDESAKNTDEAIKKIIKKGLRTSGKSASNIGTNSKFITTSQRHQQLGAKRTTSRGPPQSATIKSRRATEITKNATPVPAQRRTFLHHKQIDL